MNKHLQICVLKIPEFEKAPLDYFGCFQILATPGAQLFTSSKSSPGSWHPGTHMSALHLDTWYVICHIKEHTVPFKKSLNGTCLHVPDPHPEQYVFLKKHSLIQVL